MSGTPFSTLLVANRGEVALRIIRSAREAGYRTVAVYAAADTHARHVAAADLAVCIGGALPAQSYLNIAALVDAARRSGADAVHPGYGFLAENPHFAQACVDAGLVFVGPSPRAMAAMGHKAAAKRLMRAAGLPCVPGYDGPDQSEAVLLQEAGRIGYPVMIKAVAGGGGHGMRRVATPAEFAGLLRSAQSEALNAFGDATVLLERAVDEPRHIEIQVLADRHGNAIHLGERDCSVQRRHQKLIEEAPSPAVTPQLRERMGLAAVSAVKALGYEGLGTLEFLLDPAGAYYFMEMNTRLQVEHAVTEAVTGLDLVALQLAVAAGEPLPLRQEQVCWQGHAMELRLCAEDPAQGFLPQSGTVALWQAPAQLRVEHALASGAEVPPYYDSMVAKLIAHGTTREAARRKLARGLHDTVALGLATNQAFLARCLAHPEFASGAATTGFIGRQLQALLAPDPAQHARALALAAVLRVETDASAPPPGAGRRLKGTLPLQMRLASEAQVFNVCLHHQGDRRYRVQVDGAQPGPEQVLEIMALSAHQVRFTLDGLTQSAHFVRQGAWLQLAYRGVPVQVLDTSLAATPRANGGAASGQVRALMTGRVVALAVALGDRVAPGQPLLSLEAMKMEHAHPAPVAGTVTALHVALGQQVASGRVVVEIAPEAGGH